MHRCLGYLVFVRVGFIPGRKAFLPFPGKKLGRNIGKKRFLPESYGKELGKIREETEI